MYRLYLRAKLLFLMLCVTAYAHSNRTMHPSTLLKTLAEPVP